MSKPISTSCLFAHGGLIDFATEILTVVGLSTTDARLTADSLVAANLRGVDTHGIARLPIYVDRLRQGLVNVNPDIRVVNDGPTTVVVDGDAGLGQVVSALAIKATIDRAREHGLCWTGVRNSTHNGTQAYWALRGARAGCLTFAFTNGEAIVAPWGGRERFLSTNPVCVAVPTNPPDELVLDMATSQVAGGHILLAKSRGEPIPEGWALDSEGNPTTDPDGYLDGGTILPLGGYKGAGLSLIVDVLAGILSGGASTVDVGSMYWTFDRPQDVGHAFLAIDVERMLPLATFKNRVATTLAGMRAVTRRPGVDRIYAPGDIEREAEADRCAHGCPLTQDIIDSLCELADQLGVEKPEPID
jgi:LDH2 family malate/lactate/ureidoglycolate dehydrogenase